MIFGLPRLFGLGQSRGCVSPTKWLAPYKRHLNQDGVVAFHVSNRYLDLTPIVRQLADDVGMTTLQLIDRPSSDTRLYRSDWILVTNNKNLLQSLQESGAQNIPQKPSLTPWTGDYNNLLQILK
jgi:hypothetical protein